MGVAGPGVGGTEGTDVDDAAAEGAQMGQSLARDQEGAARIRGENVVPLIESEAFERGGGEDSGVVDEDVETAEFGDDGGNGVANGGFGSDVAMGGKGAAAEGSHLRGGLRGLSLRIEEGDGDIGAGVREADGDGAADATRSAGDEGGFTS